MKALWVVALTLLSCLSHAQAPQPPEIAARAYLLMDVSTQQILADKDADALTEPASLTKLMTAYLVFDALRSKKLDLHQTLAVSERAAKTPGPRMYVAPSMQVSVEDLIKGMLVQSGNDAAMVLAEGVGGTVEHFVRMMNDQAKAWGMVSTGYKNPTGLTEVGHVSTAREIGVLSARLLADFPDHAAYFAIKRYHYPGMPAANDSNRNVLLFRDPSVDGLITGYTDAAGYGMVATAKHDVAGRAGTVGARRLLAVVLGAANDNVRASETQKLLNWGFAAFETVQLFDAGQAVVTSRVWQGSSSRVGMGHPAGVVVSVPLGVSTRLTTQVIRNEPLMAPITKGQVIGTLRVMVGEQTVAQVPLLALEAVEQAGVWGRAWDALRLWIQ